MSHADELARLEFPALPAFVGVARTLVAAVAITVDGIDEARREDLRIAVSEACTNAVEAQLSGGLVQLVTLRCLADEERFEVRIEDSGAGFDPAALRPRPAVGPELLRSERGWGLQLIRALVDEAHFTSTSTGTAVRLVLHRGAVEGP
ncbi:MAG: ATP-binding protein [Acidimicrobiales bacterium]